MIPQFLRLKDGLNRKEKLLLITYYFLIGACLVMAAVDYVNSRALKFVVYNLVFALLFIGLYFYTKKYFEASLLWLALCYQAFVFGHAYFLNPGTQSEVALGTFICVAPLFFKGNRLWILFAVNLILFHICLFHAGYDKFFNGLYFLYAVVFWVVKTLVRDNERFEKDLVTSKRQVEKNAAQLEQAYAFKTRFFINITHELKTPLTLILSPIRSLLNGGRTSKEDRQLLEVVDKNAYILLNRVNQLLELSKIDRNEISINKEHFDIVQLVQALRDQFLPLAIAKKITLTAAHHSIENRIIYSDQVKVEMILSNVISNALKFSDIEGKVDLDYEDKDEFIQLSVCDNGIGIPEKDRVKVFQRFYQVDRKDYHEGSGIGLALSEELIQKLEGEIWVEGNADRGCTFYVKIPRGPAKAPVHEDQQPATKGLPASAMVYPQETSQPTVLLVEDNQDLSQYIKLLLTKSYNVLLATNGQEALDILEKLSANHTPPSLIITDLMMPMMSGQELVKKLKLDNRFVAIPIVVMTALAEMGIKLDLIRIGVDDYITKPFFENELLTIIEKHLPAVPKAEAPVAEKEEQVSVSDMKWLQDVEGIVLEKIGDTDFMLQDLASKLFMSPRTMQIKLKQLTGKTPKQYQRAIILQYARDKIQTGAFNTVYAVSMSIGFEDQYYFSTLYKKHFGITPKDEIARIRS
ncbi:MAG: ATP-binding protein [Bacteroidota bacterium]